MPKADTQIITLQCEQCKNRNYTTTKNRKAHSGRLELRKYCKFCRTHTVHREVR
ncbi:MAG TPA: 50S ribosomal protein L33 [Firmicutes bacterium]|nr:50S ribosomal protein L33 [Candidatus Fermentithermobacillaceae bacterium]